MVSTMSIIQDGHHTDLYATFVVQHYLKFLMDDLVNGLKVPLDNIQD